MSRSVKLLEIREDLLRAGYISRGTFNLEGVRTQINVDIQAVFKHSQILIPRAEESLDVRANRNTFLHSVLAHPPSRLCVPFSYVIRLDGISPTRVPTDWHCQVKIGLSRVKPTGMLADQRQAGSIAVSVPPPMVVVNALRQGCQDGPASACIIKGSDDFHCLS